MGYIIADVDQSCGKWLQYREQKLRLVKRKNTRIVVYYSMTAWMTILNKGNSGGNTIHSRVGRVIRLMKKGKEKGSVKINKKI